ncbi:aldose epimerase family protein [Flavobacterium seoulense]|uniref:Aldose 1-epimerase n=1 Tax=Flavobacterium seoulense TaxID=1492738 RepID=A0A066WVJ8_9FLAO|nr:aldose epimerase family protein [Flavobacterium seoulense]KDN56623.1 aldose 1-epimerase [Flavobacterium seoulense]
MSTSENNLSHYELTNKNGAKLKVIPFGATVTSLKIPTKNGELVDVVLGFDTVEGYEKSFQLDGSPYMGATVGRYAGRISEGKFELNGKNYQLNINNNANSLHGGIDNFSQKNWNVDAVTTGENPSITLSYVSAAGEENFPGEFSVSLTYTLSEENELILEYKATTTEDTIINLTHHSYFNLDGHKSDVSGQDLIVHAQKVVETREDCIPTGNILEVANTSFDYRTAKKCPKSIDNTFVVEDNNEVKATLFSPKTNLKMDVYTDQPGVHIYVGGNCGPDLKGKENATYHALSGICFETQNFPDAPNHAHFPNAVLKKGDTYEQKTVYKFESL